MELKKRKLLTSKVSLTNSRFHQSYRKGILMYRLLMEMVHLEFLKKKLPPLIWTCPIKFRPVILLRDQQSKRVVDSRWNKRRRMMLMIISNVFQSNDRTCIIKKRPKCLLEDKRNSQLRKRLQSMLDNSVIKLVIINIKFRLMERRLIQGFKDLGRNLRSELNRYSLTFLVEQKTSIWQCNLRKR